MLRQLSISLSLFLVFALCSLAQDSRHFTFHYAFTVRNLPAGKKVRIWVPAAQSDAYQEVKIISAQGDLPLQETVEPKYGNQIYYAETRSAQPELHFDVEYDVVRHERIALGQTAPRVVAASLSSEQKQQDLQPDILVPITGLPADLAAKVTQGKTQPLDKARAIYDYVFTTMRYDKTGTGWGHGDVLYACDAKKGTAPTSIPSSSPWRDPKESRPVLRSGSHCPPTSTPPRSPDTTAGPISGSMVKGGFPWTFPRLGSTRKSVTISLALTT